jgi:hypothetical protein
VLQRRGGGCHFGAGVVGSGPGGGKTRGLRVRQEEARLVTRIA